jgi:8-oxo-dGTP pyrophosphatase MutT (NUDIX family)
MGMNEVNEEHFVGKVAQKAILLQNDQVFLVRDPRETKEIWELPGGRLNLGEKPKEGLIREIYEELGVLVDVHEVVHLQQFTQGNEGISSLMIAYRVTLQNPGAKFNLDPKEIVEARFVPLADAVKLNLFPEYKRALEVYLNK